LSFQPDVNSDPIGRLRLIPGIGPVKAAAIVRERLEHGPFSNAEDVQVRVVGIGPALERQIADFAIASAATGRTEP
jgi:competence protein ComEA